MTFEEKVELIASMQVTFQQKMAELREWSEEAQKRHEKAHKEFEERHKHNETKCARIEALLRRAVWMAIREARNERQRQKVLDEKITQLSAAQLVTEEKLQSFIDSLKRGTNGHNN